MSICCGWGMCACAREREKEEERTDKKEMKKATRGQERPSQEGLGSIFYCFGGSWGVFGRVLGGLGRLLGHLGGVLEASWAVLRSSWAVMGCYGRFWLNKARGGIALGPILDAQKGAKMRPNGTQEGPKSTSKTKMQKEGFEDGLGAVLGRSWLVLGRDLES